MTVSIGEVATFPDVVPDKVQALKILEESAEVFGAWQSLDHALMVDVMNGSNAASARERGYLLDECADVVQAVCNLIAALGVDDFTPWMEACRKRNEDRGRL